MPLPQRSVLASTRLPALTAPYSSPTHRKAAQGVELRFGQLSEETLSVGETPNTPVYRQARLPSLPARTSPREPLLHAQERFGRNESEREVARHQMHFGSNTFLGPGARIMAREGFYLGDHSGAGPGFLVIGGNRNIAAAGVDMLDVKTGGENLPVVVERDVYMGALVKLLKGVVVGEGSVIGACSVVRKRAPSFTIAAGSPCRPLRPRFTPDKLRRHLAAWRSRPSYDEVIEHWRAAGLL